MGFISGFPKRHPALDEQMERIGAIYDAYCAKLDGGSGPRDSHITLIARSVLSPVCRMLVTKAGDLQRHGVSVQAIFAKLGPAEPMNAMFSALETLNGVGKITASLRWAQNPCLLDAHEQLTLGVRMCWTGDCMRRSEDRRNSLDLFEENSIGSVRISDLNFSSMWAASKPLPREIMEIHELSGDAMPGVDAATVAETLPGTLSSPVVVKFRAKH